jgi:hypothetical protein
MLKSLGPVAKEAALKCFKDYKTRCFDNFVGHSKIGPHVAVSNKWLEKHSALNGHRLPSHFTFEHFKPAESKGSCHISRRLGSINF